MKKITITLDEKTSKWASAYAAELNTSPSSLIGEMLTRRMHELADYDRAMRAYLAKLPVKLGRAGKRYPTREELHDRARLR